MQGAAGSLLRLTLRANFIGSRRAVSDPTFVEMKLLSSLKSAAFGSAAAAVVAPTSSTSITATPPAFSTLVGFGLANHVSRGGAWTQDAHRGPLPSLRRTVHCRRRRHLSSAAMDKGTSSPDYSEPNSTVTTDFATSYHAPVMAKECIDALLGIRVQKTKKRKKGRKDRQRSDKIDGPDKIAQSEPVDRQPMVFVDGTLGGGGHSAALLQRLRAGDVVFGCDVDPSALSTATERLRQYTMAGMESDSESESESESTPSATLPLFVPVQSNFRDLADTLPTMIHPVTGKRILELPSEDKVRLSEASFVGVDGMLLDLGVSSHQIDTADRGFAFMKDGPLDMRMWGGDWSSVGSSLAFKSANAGTADTDVPRGLTAADICNEFDEAELCRIFRVYGDEPRARKIACAIVDARPLATTSDLVEAVSSVTPKFAKKGRRLGRVATLARIFQSLRIVVNEEEEALIDVFEDAAPALVRQGGRLVVLSYHSLEDRATKRVIRDGSVAGNSRLPAAVERDIYGNVVGKPRPWKLFGKKQKATDDEVNSNTRARSATLRVGERQRQ